MSLGGLERSAHVAVQSYHEPRIIEIDCTAAIVYYGVLLFDCASVLLYGIYCLSKIPALNAVPGSMTTKDEYTKYADYASRAWSRRGSRRLRFQNELSIG